MPSLLVVVTSPSGGACVELAGAACVVIGSSASVGLDVGACDVVVVICVLAVLVHSQIASEDFKLWEQVILY